MVEKIKLRIIKVEEEETLDKVSLLRITLQSKMGSYERGVALADWEDERKQRSIKKHWLKSIGAIEEAEKTRQSKPEEERKAEMKAKIKDIEGTVIEDE